MMENYYIYIIFPGKGIRRPSYTLLLTSPCLQVTKYTFSVISPCLRHSLLITLPSRPCDTKLGAIRSLSIASLSIEEIHVSLDRVLPAVLLLIISPRSTDQLAEKDILQVSYPILTVFAYPEKRSTDCQPPREVQLWTQVYIDLFRRPTRKFLLINRATSDGPPLLKRPDSRYTRT